MQTAELNIVTGALSFTGNYITRRLLRMGKRVRTLTRPRGRAIAFGDQVEVFPLVFDSPSELTKSMAGATTLFNTYWIRFPHGRITFEMAVKNTKTLIEAAVSARVRKIVHLSVANPSENSELPYFRGKSEVERAIKESGLSYAILRPTVIFGAEDILINNIAWLLRRFPIFVIFGSGTYRLQPVFVEDVAELAVRASQSAENVTVDAAGPEVYRFEELVRLIRDKIGSRARLWRVRPRWAPLFSRALNALVNDVVLTREELQGLMRNLLVSASPPAGHTRLSQWLEENADRVGTRYASELDRHFR